MSAELKRYDLQLADTDGAPIVSATVNVYWEGAKVGATKEITTIGDVVTFYDLGEMRAGDVYEIFNTSTWGTGTNITCVSVDSNTTATMSVATGSQVVNAGDQLVLKSRTSGDVRPRLYSSDNESDLYQTESGGYTTDGSVTSDATGLAWFFTKAQTFEVVISGSGVTTSLLVEQQGGRASYFHDANTQASFDNTEGTGARNSIGLQDLFRQTSRSDNAVGRISTPRGVAYLSDEVQIDAGATANPDGGRFILEGEPYTEFKLDSSYSDSRGFYISGAYRHDTLVFKHVTFDGNSVAGVSMLKLAAGCREIIIEDCWFKNIAAGCVHLGATGATSATLIEHFHIVRNHFDTCGGTAINIVDARYGEISGNTFNSIPASATCINILPGASGDFSRNIVIDRNHIFTSGTAWNGILSAGYGIPTGDDSTDESFAVWVTNNAIIGSTRAIYLQQYHNLHVEGNEVLQYIGTTYGGIELNACRNSYVRGNTVDGEGGTGDEGITIDGCYHTDVSGNTVFDCGESGIILVNAYDTRVRGNDCHDNNQDDGAHAGIEVQAASYRPVIVGNTITDNGTTMGAGLIIADSTTHDAYYGDNLILNNSDDTVSDTSTNATAGTNKTS